MTATKKTAIHLICLLLCFCTFSSYAFDSNEDVAGASDSELFQRYPRSKIDEFSQTNTEDYLLSLSAAKTVNGVMELEYFERLAGKLTRITYRAPDAEPSDMVFAHFRTQLKKLPHNLLFECHGRECGDSNEWANRIFEVRELYGPDRYQHYLAAQLNTDQGPLFLALYSIQRGNKRVYFQLDLLKPTKGSAVDLAVNPDTILDVLKSDGVFSLPNLTFDDNNQLTSDADKRLAAVVTALKKSSRLKLYVVGHVAGSDDLDILKSRSQARAETVRNALVEAGIKEERLSAQGVGPLAPVRKGSESANRIGLVVQ